MCNKSNLPCMDHNPLLNLPTPPCDQGLAGRCRSYWPECNFPPFVLHHRRHIGFATTDRDVWDNDMIGSIWQGLRCCRKLSPICQQNSDASKDALKWFPDSLNWPLMHKLSKYVWPFGRENLFSLKKILKRPFSAAENRHHFISGGPGGKTVDTRSTFGAPLKTLGYNGSN